MRNGVIIEDHRIIALDLRNTLSQDYNILGIVSNSDEARNNILSDVDFLIMDTDVKGSFRELMNIMNILDSRNAKVILLTSLPRSLLNPPFKYSELVFKPFQKITLIEAIEKAFKV
jgi:DNA-binding NarL/FixJ family response regulator